MKSTKRQILPLVDYGPEVAAYRRQLRQEGKESGQTNHTANKFRSHKP